MMQYLRRLALREDGQTMAEYAVMLGVISVTVMVALGFLSGQIGSAFTATAAYF